MTDKSKTPVSAQEKAEMSAQAHNIRTNFVVWKHQGVMHPVLAVNTQCHFQLGPCPPILNYCCQSIA